MTWFRGTRLGHKAASALVALMLIVAFTPTASASYFDSDALLVSYVTESASTGYTSPTGPMAEFPDSMSLARVNVAIGADVVHAAGYTGAGIDVAVIDTGVNNV
ncbi:MAG: hypothetical protein OEU32_06475, partial [Acidimicrobiia bacterium]|nr:hypothetical protein [Acidimicrobiia bacterium]